MHDLNLANETFDLIWSEGALYCMGFREGLTACHRLLVPRGTLAVTELTWLKPDPPDECRNFFAKEYPAMTDVSDNLATSEACDYTILDHFTLPESAWRESFYDPLEARLTLLRKLYAQDHRKREMIEATQTEIDLFRKHSSYYGYVFYLMKPNGTAR